MVDKLGISQAAYVTGKLPTAAGTPAGLVLQDRNQQPDVFRVKKRAASHGPRPAQIR